jgi:hypothetical protein
MITHFVGIRTWQNHQCLGRDGQHGYRISPDVVCCEAETAAAVIFINIWKVYLSL